MRPQRAIASAPHLNPSHSIPPADLPMASSVKKALMLATGRASTSIASPWSLHSHTTGQQGMSAVLCLAGSCSQESAMQAQKHKQAAERWIKRRRNVSQTPRVHPDCNIRSRQGREALRQAAAACARRHAFINLCRENGLPAAADADGCANEERGQVS